MIAAMRIAAGVGMILVSLFVASGLPVKEGPSLSQFLYLMIVPPLAAFALAPKTIRFAFIAGAVYALLAAARQMMAPEGNITVTEQLSSAALASLLLPIVARIFR